MGSSWIEYKGKKILYQDYHGETEAQMLVSLEQAGKLAAASPTSVLSLSNVENASITDAFMKRSKEMGKEVFKAKIAKSAIFGMTGLKSIFLSSYTKLLNVDHLRACKTKEEALEWLVSGDLK